MTNLTNKEVCIGCLGQQKVYLNWSDVKDICTNAVAEAYEQVRQENAQLKELLKQVLRHELSLKEVTELTRKISEVLGDSRR